jgi:RNA-binding protein YhbY
MHFEHSCKLDLGCCKEGFIRSVDAALARHEQVKIKLAEFKAEKKVIAAQLAEQTASHLVMRVGNVMVLHRPGPVVAEPAVAQDISSAQ